jgi:hypothetical protein
MPLTVVKSGMFEVERHTSRATCASPELPVWCRTAELGGSRPGGFGEADAVSRPSFMTEHRIPTSTSSNSAADLI